MFCMLLVGVSITTLFIFNYHPTTIESYTESHIDTVDEILGSDLGTWVFEEGKQPYKLLTP